MCFRIYEPIIFPWVLERLLLCIFFYSAIIFAHIYIYTQFHITIPSPPNHPHKPRPVGQLKFHR